MLGEEGSHLFLKMSSPSGPGWEAGRGGHGGGQGGEPRRGQRNRKEGRPGDDSQASHHLPDATGVRSGHSASLWPPPFCSCPQEPLGVARSSLDSASYWWYHEEQRVWSSGGEEHPVLSSRWRGLAPANGSWEEKLGRSPRCAMPRETWRRKSGSLCPSSTTHSFISAILHGDGTEVMPRQPPELGFCGSKPNPAFF